MRNFFGIKARQPDDTVVSFTSNYGDRNTLDGLKLTEISLVANLTTQEEVKELIDVLIVARWCFPESPIKYTEAKKLFDGKDFIAGCDPYDDNKIVRVETLITDDQGTKVETRDLKRYPLTKEECFPPNIEIDANIGGMPVKNTLTIGGEDYVIVQKDAETLWCDNLISGRAGLTVHHDPKMDYYTQIKKK